MKCVAMKDPVFSCAFGGNVTVLSSPSSKFSINGNGVHRGPLNILVTGSSAGGAAANAVGVGVVNPTATKTSCDGMNVIRDGDVGYIGVAGTDSDGDPTFGIEIATITSTIQGKVKSN